MSFNLGAIGAVVTLNTTQFDKGMQGLPNTAEKTFKNIASMATKYLSMQAVSKTLVSGVQASMAFNKELYNIKSIAQDLDFDKISNGLLNLSSELGNAKDNANAFYFAYSAGVKGSEEELVKFTGQISKLSKTILSDQTATMDAATTVMNAYNLSAEQGVEVSDLFTKIVQKGKTTGEALASTIGNIAGVASSAGVSMDDLGASLSTLTTTMPTAQAVTNLTGIISNFIKPTEQAKKIANEFGIDLSVNAIKSKGFANVVGEIKEKLNGNTEALAKIFPNLEGLKGILALTGDQYAMFSDNVDEFHNKAGATAEAFEIQSKNLDNQLAILPDTLNKLSISVGDATKYFLTFGGAITPLLSKFNSMSSETQTFIGKLAFLTSGLIAFNVAKNSIGTLKDMRAFFKSHSDISKSTSAMNGLTKATNEVSSSTQLAKYHVEQMNLALKKKQLTHSGGSKIMIATNKTLEASFVTLKLAIANIGTVVAVAFAGYEVGKFLGQLMNLEDKFTSILLKIRGINQAQAESIKNGEFKNDPSVATVDLVKAKERQLEIENELLKLDNSKGKLEQSGNNEEVSIIQAQIDKLNQESDILHKSVADYEKKAKDDIAKITKTNQELQNIRSKIANKEGARKERKELEKQEAELNNYQLSLTATKVHYNNNQERLKGFDDNYALQQALELSQNLSKSKIELTIEPTIEDLQLPDFSSDYEAMIDDLQRTIEKQNKHENSLKNDLVKNKEEEQKNYDTAGSFSANVLNSMLGNSIQEDIKANTKTTAKNVQKMAEQMANGKGITYDN